MEGTIEIMHHGKWGTVCDHGWDDMDATVVCRQLGFLNGTATRQAYFGTGSGPVWLSQVDCLGNETKLSHCIHNEAGNVGNCSHKQVAGVQCNGIGKWMCMYFEYYTVPIAFKHRIYLF